MTTEMTNRGLKPPVSSFFGSFFIALLITNYSYYDDDGGAAGDDKRGLRYPMNSLQRRDNDHDNATMETNEERGTSPVPVTNPPSTKRNSEMTGDVGRWNEQKTSNDVSWAVGMFFFSLFCY